MYASASTVFRRCVNQPSLDSSLMIGAAEAQPQEEEMHRVVVINSFLHVVTESELEERRAGRSRRSKSWSPEGRRLVQGNLKLSMESKFSSSDLFQEDDDLLKSQNSLTHIQDDFKRLETPSDAGSMMSVITEFHFQCHGGVYPMDKDDLRVSPGSDVISSPLPWTRGEPSSSTDTMSWNWGTVPTTEKLLWADCCDDGDSMSCDQQRVGGFMPTQPCAMYSTMRASSFGFSTVPFSNENEQFERAQFTSPKGRTGGNTKSIGIDVARSFSKGSNSSIVTCSTVATSMDIADAGGVGFSKEAGKKLRDLIKMIMLPGKSKQLRKLPEIMELLSKSKDDQANAGDADCNQPCIQSLKSKGKVNGGARNRPSKGLRDDCKDLISAVDASDYDDALKDAIFTHLASSSKYMGGLLLDRLMAQ
eukprot:TRINITY_DN16826_c0_g1_i5.p1 TRINITY_DN16826_c0_g1~~TRINITY_DN16826_c0_g1_i5.p1  ORF type:complete len:419 (-),score=92.61 TRINITY_DN16826_c0_g1_i5:346-1602(-)